MCAWSLGKTGVKLTATVALDWIVSSGGASWGDTWCVSSGRLRLCLTPDKRKFALLSGQGVLTIAMTISPAALVSAARARLLLVVNFVFMLNKIIKTNFLASIFTHNACHVGLTWKLYCYSTF